MSIQAFQSSMQDQDDQHQDNGGQKKTVPGRTRKSPSAFRTISEVAEEVGVQQHVLRFWETKFSQVRPLKRGGGRRYYRPEDVELLKRIYDLLYTEGYTIKGVQKLMREKGKNAILYPDQPEQQAVHKGPLTGRPVSGLNEKHKAVLKSMLLELKELRRIVKGG